MPFVMNKTQEGNCSESPGSHVSSCQYTKQLGHEEEVNRKATVHWKRREETPFAGAPSPCRRATVWQGTVDSWQRAKRIV